MFSVKPNFSMRLQSIPKINQHMACISFTKVKGQKWKERDKKGSFSEMTDQTDNEN